MRLLVIDAGHLALDFCVRCVKANHEVKWFIRKEDGEVLKVGDGMVEKVPQWERWVRWADLIFFADNTFYMHNATAMKEQGFRVFGPTFDGAELELDRQRGQELLAKRGVPVIPSEEFNNYDKAIAHVQKTLKRYVSKPSGDANKALSYVAKDPADMIFMLQRWKELNKIKSPFILQEFRGGIEVAVGGWIGPKGFLPDRWFENFEHKKLMNDDLGVNTGEMGTLGKYVRESKLADDVLVPVEKDLIRLGITGYVDVNCIVTEDGDVWPLEFTVRPGWPCFNLQLAAHKGDPAQWMFDLLDGRDTLEVDYGHVCGVVLAIPDFPYSKLTKKEVSGYPIYGLEKIKDENQIHFCEVMQGKAPAMEGDKLVMSKELPVTAGDYVLVTSGIGETVQKAVRKAYGALELIQLPNSPMYRTDIGDRLKDQLDVLYGLGYCREWSY